MNRLATESSPYLLQHAANPVEWYPWSTEALDRARREDRPILLSIGYAACHWCHVMAHESFENEETARLMNELFVNIKVDREERPDLDAIYMSAVQAMTGHGGWPMTVFLTPEGVPFHGGTYYPPDDRHGMPSFRRVLRAVADAYRERRGDVERAAQSVRALYAHAEEAARGTGPLSPVLLERAQRALDQQYDERHGGFGGAPKFPQTMALDFLLRHWRRTGSTRALEMARDSFLAMARGGIHDQVGGGFHRYSVDAEWLVPHFEKMLYDNALLARLGAHLWQATGDAEIRRAAEDTIAWLAREMLAPEGAFYSSLDADSEGEEGKFYVWSESEIASITGADAPLVEAYWGVTAAGNFEGRNILHVPAPASVVAARAGVSVDTLRDAVERGRRALLAARDGRVRPGRDEKILAGWNGLALRTLAECARIFANEQWGEMARRGGEFLFRTMVRDGRALRVHAAGVTRGQGYLEDQASVALCALALYELTFEREWLRRAELMTTEMVRWFWDERAAAFYDTAHDHEALIARPREVTDNAVPSGTSLATELLLRLGELLHDEEMRRRATWVLETLAEPMARYPQAFGHLLGVAHIAITGAVEVAIVGDPRSDDFRALAREVSSHYLPSLVLAGGAPGDDDGVALLAGRTLRDGRATVYVCREYVCDAPVTDAASLGEQLERAGAEVVRA